MNLKILNFKYAPFLLLLLILFTRFAFLEADPSFVKRLGDISDEGVWGADPRHAVLFNDWWIGDAHFGLDSTPLYMYLLQQVFLLFGPTLFALRFLPAISGFLTAVLIYFFVKKLTNKSQALLATAIFGLGSAPFIYHRLGQIETTLSLFLLAMFIAWHYGQKNKFNYFLSGFLYALAFLIKFTALFFAPAIILYWVYTFMQKKWSWHGFLYFCFGAIIPILTYFKIFLIPNWSKISQAMLLHGQNNFFGYTFMINAFKILGNNLFALPTFFLLSVLFLLYLLQKLSSWQNFKVLFTSLTPLEGLSLSWIFGGFMGILFSDISDRRVTIMFIPLAILASHLICHWQEFSMRRTANNLKLSFPLTLFLLFPLFSFPYIILRLVAKESVYFTAASVLIFLGYILTTLLLTPKKSRILNKLVLFSFIFFFLLNPLTVLFRHFSRHVAIVLSAMRYETIFILIATLITSIILLVTIFLLWENNLRKKLPQKILLVYFIISFILIGNVLLTPSFTSRDNSEKLADITQPNQIIFGEGAEELVYGTDLVYYYYTPFHAKFSQLNQDLFQKRPRYFSYPVVFDGKRDRTSEKAILDHVKQRHNLKLLDTISLYRYPLSNKYKVELEIYELQVKQARNPLRNRPFT